MSDETLSCNAALMLPFLQIPVQQVQKTDRNYLRCQQIMDEVEGIGQTCQLVIAELQS
jgi:hypothetical protein